MNLKENKTIKIQINTDGCETLAFDGECNVATTDNAKHFSFSCGNVHYLISLNDSSFSMVCKSDGVSKIHISKEESIYSLELNDSNIIKIPIKVIDFKNNSDLVYLCYSIDEAITVELKADLR